MGRRRGGRIGCAAESAHAAAEVSDLPEGQTEVDEAESGHCAARPAGSDGLLQNVKPRLLRHVDEKEVVAPIAQAERVHPRQERQHDARFQAQDDVKDDG